MNQAMQEQIGELQTQLHAVQEKLRTEEHHSDEVRDAMLTTVSLIDTEYRNFWV